MSTATRPMIDVAGIPEGLRRLQRFILWRFVVRDGRPTKVPCGPRGEPIPWTDQARWLDFDEAVQACRNNPDLAGLGIVLGDGLVGFDSDDCIGDDGIIDPETVAILDRLGTYAEVSPSGRGIKAFGLGPEVLPDGKRGRNDPGDRFEFYTSGRWFAVTGWRLPESPEDVAECGDAFSEVYQQRYPSEAPERRVKPSNGHRPTGNGSADRFALTALANELAAVETAPEGSRNSRLNEAAFNLGQLVGAGLLGRQHVADALLESAERAGLGRTEAERTIASGLSAGIAEPRDLSNVRALRNEAPRPDPGPQVEPSANGSGRNGRPAATHRDSSGPLPQTELGLAERFVRQHGHDLRFCHPWHKWLIWDGQRFKVDDRAQVRLRAKATIRALYAEASGIEDDEKRKAFIKWAGSCERKQAIDAMIALATFHEGIPITPDEMDRDPWLLNVQNGTLDLRTGRLRPHRREDILTKVAPVEFHPDATCPLWTETLERFLPSEGLRRYVQRLTGYSFTGVVRDHILPIAYGTGSNGKSTILGTLLDLLGDDYAMKAAPDLLMSKDRDDHPTGRTTLFGKRLIVAIETEEGRRLNETMVKELTGGDAITARRMKEDFWSFRPTHKIVMATNHKPSVRGTDHGIWRRLRLIPFTVVMPDDQADKTMPERLKAEYPGILAWAVRGCLEWQRDGLGEPDEVSLATQGYRADEDVLGRFLAEYCVIHPEARIRAGDLYARYKQWAETVGQGVLSLVRFGKAISERGFEKEGSKYISYRGIGLRREQDTQEMEVRDL